MRRFLATSAAYGLLAVMLSLTAGCNSRQPAGGTVAGGSGAAKKDKPRVAFVTNQIADFWNIAKAGCLDAQKDFDVEVDVRMPAEATAVEQERIVEDLLNSGIDGIAISPLDADNQKAMIDRVAAKIPLITQDSDAPGTKRLMYIGVDNYGAGRMCGKLVKRALPKGGNVMLFIGRLEQANSKQRRQGVIDELLDREPDPNRFDKDEDKPIKGEKYTILDTITDTGSQTVCQQKAADVLVSADVQAMVGLFEYNPPAILQALKQAGKLGKIQVIGFDENDATLQAIKDGTCIGTVVQNPYKYGYESVRVLVALAKGDKSVIPESKFLDVPARSIDKKNVDAFWAKLRSLKGTQ